MVTKNENFQRVLGLLGCNWFRLLNLLVMEIPRDPSDFFHSIEYEGVILYFKDLQMLKAFHKAFPYSNRVIMDEQMYEHLQKNMKVGYQKIDNKYFKNIQLNIEPFSEEQYVLYEKTNLKIINRFFEKEINFSYNKDYNKDYKKNFFINQKNSFKNINGDSISPNIQVNFVKALRHFTFGDSIDQFYDEDFKDAVSILFENMDPSLQMSKSFEIAIKNKDSLLVAHYLFKLQNVLNYLELNTLITTYVPPFVILSEEEFYPKSELSLKTENTFKAFKRFFSKKEIFDSRFFNVNDAIEVERLLENIDYILNCQESELFSINFPVIHEMRNLCQNYLIFHESLVYFNHNLLDLKKKICIFSNFILSNNITENQAKTFKQIKGAAFEIMYLNQRMFLNGQIDEIFCKENFDKVKPLLNSICIYQETLSYDTCTLEDKNFIKILRNIFENILHIENLSKKLEICPNQFINKKLLKLTVSDLTSDLFFDKFVKSDEFLVIKEKLSSNFLSSAIIQLEKVIKNYEKSGIDDYAYLMFLKKKQ